MPKRRYLELDVFRGLAVFMMVFFHFLYDFNMFHVTYIPLFTHPLWIVYRETAVFLFLTISGIALFLDHGKHGEPPNTIHWKSFWKRTLRLAAAALTITIATYLYNKQLAIFFGILHFIAFSAILALPLVRFPRAGIIIAAFLLLLGHVADLNDPIHYIPHIAWLGFGSLKMKTYEIIPLIPYFGYIALGVFIAAYQKPFEKDYLVVSLNPTCRLNRLLAKIGRHALMIYLLHRPISMAIVYFFFVYLT